MPYRLEIGGALDSLGSELRVNDTIPVAPVDLGEEHFEPTGPITFDVTLTNAGAGIIATGTVQGRMRVTCARCLREFELDITGEADGFYVAPGHEEDTPEESEPEPIHDGSIDLEPALSQALIVALPFAPVCAPDCRGLCAQCGADMNEAPCDCASAQTPNPFAALADLVDIEDSAEIDAPAPDDAEDAGS